MIYKSEIRESIIQVLLEKVKKQNYKTYLSNIRLEKIRQFNGGQINFDFPVTALIGPNGSGKTTILNNAACTYGRDPNKFFPKSTVGDDSMDDWIIEFEIIDKSVNPKGTIKNLLTFKDNKWTLKNNFDRNIKLFTINRTVPPSENSTFMLRKKLKGNPKGKIVTKKIPEIDKIKLETEKILGKPMNNFELLEISYYKPLRKSRQTITKNIIEIENVLYRGNPIKQLLFIGGNGNLKYSEFSFGAGESSVLRIVTEIEAMHEQSLILIEEIENGLHPLALLRLVDYLINTAHRKGIQVIFTTHSDYATYCLPSEAVWACIDGKLEQGKLSVEVLRAVTGRIDKKLAIFVEDEFTKSWLESIIRAKLLTNLPEIGIYPMFGDDSAIKTHLSHNTNPAIAFKSICFIDGDSSQNENNDNEIYKLPGEQPELTVFNSVLNNLERNIALLTVAFQLAPDKQYIVKSSIESISRTNRDPHLIFSQIGIELGFIPETIIRGAFLSIWVQENETYVNNIVKILKDKF
jgi:predicted ATPase